MINKNSKIFIAGHKGMVGSALHRLLQNKGYKNIICESKNNLNLLDQNKSYNFLKKNKPDVVVIAAAKVGGINANNLYRADFIYQNLQIQNNLIHGSYLAGVKKLIFLGSSCIYPRDCRQPIKEEYLLTGPLETTNEPYAIAKIAGLKMIESYNKQYKTNYHCLMPCNLYGPNDNYDLLNSHFFPALLIKIYLAKRENMKKILLWGDGSPRRELMHVDDFARVILFFIKKNIKFDYLNIGTGQELTIKGYAKKIADIFCYKGEIIFNSKKQNGTPRKLLDCSKFNKYNWIPKKNLDIEIKYIFNEFNKINQNIKSLFIDKKYFNQ